MSVPAASQQQSRSYFPEISHHQATLTAGAIGAAALAVAAYAATAIFMPAIRGSLSQTGAIILASTTGATALACAIGALTIHVMDPKRYSKQHPPIPLEEIESLPIRPDLAKDVLSNIQLNINAEESFAAVRVNGRDYHFYGPAQYVSKKSRALAQEELARSDVSQLSHAERKRGEAEASERNKQRALQAYFNEIRRFDVIVSLLDPNEPGEAEFLYQNLPEFSEAYPNQLKYSHWTVHHNPQNNKSVNHIHQWKDGEREFPVENALQYYRIAESVIASARGRSIYIHCWQGWRRTSTFAVMCELAAHQAQIRQMTNDQIRGFISRTLYQISENNGSRLPRETQLRTLLSDEFINGIRAVQ
jgi:hypothetical protein